MALIVPKNKAEDPLFLVTLINLVEKYPCIWNNNIKGYSKSEHVRLAWRKIATELMLTEQECRDKWRNIRCAFVRARRTAYRNKSKKTYYLAKHLTFLLPYMKIKNTSKTEFNETHTPHEENSYEGYEEDYEAQEENSETLVKAEPEMELDSQIRLQFVDSLPPLFENKIFKKTSASPSQTQFGQSDVEQIASHSEEEDTDWLFLRSLLPDIRKLNDKQKRKFKTRVMLCLDELLEELE